MAPGVGRSDAEVPGLVDAPAGVAEEPRNTEVLEDAEEYVPEDPRSAPRSPYRIDNRIIESRTEEGVLENASNSWLVQFRAMSEGGVRLRTFEGDWLEFEAVAESDAAPMIDESGTSVTYPEVWPGVDLQYVVTDSRVEEVIVAKQDPGRSEFDFEVRGSALRADGSGGFDVVRVPGSGSPMGVPGESTGMALAPVVVTNGSMEVIPAERAAPAASVLGEVPVPAPAEPEPGSPGAEVMGAPEGGGGVATDLRISVSPELFATAAPGEYPIRIDPTADMPDAHLGVDKYSSIQQGVNLGTGNYTAEVLDSHISVPGPPLELRRTYNSNPSSSQAALSVWSGLGWGWTGSLLSLAFYDSVNDWIHLYRTDGSVSVFAAGNGGWLPPPGSTSVLEGSIAGGLTLTELDGSQMVFTDGVLTEKRDPAGNVQRIAHVEYQTTFFGGNPVTVKNVSEVLDESSGRRLRLSYMDVPAAPTDPILGAGTAHKVLSAVEEVAANGVVTGSWRYEFSTTGRFWGSLMTDVYSPGQSIGGPHVRYVYSGLCFTQKLSEIYRPDGTLEAQIGYEGVIPNGGTCDQYATTKVDGSMAATTFAYQRPPSPYEPGEVKTVMTDARGYQTEWEFDTRFRLIRRTDPTGASRYWNYYSDDDLNPATADGLLKEVVHEDGGRDTYTYWPSGALRSETDRYGAKTWYEYDSHNRITEIRDPRSSSESDNTFLTTTAYPAGTAANTPASITPPAPLAATTHTYYAGTEAAVGGGLTPKGLIKQTVSPSEGTTKFFYESDGDLARTEDGKGLTTSYTYDAMGREVSRTESGSGVPSSAWITTYDAAGRVSTVLEPAVTNPVDSVARQKLTTNTYDDNGLLKTVTESDAKNAATTRTTTYGYDGVGRRKSESVSSGASSVVSTTEYDAMGNVSAVVDQNGNRYEKTYDSRGNPDKLVLKNYQDDPQAGSTQFDLVVSDEDYDADNRKAAEVDALGRRIEYSAFTYGGSAGGEAEGVRRAITRRGGHGHGQRSRPGAEHLRQGRQPGEVGGGKWPADHVVDLQRCGVEGQRGGCPFVSLCGGQPDGVVLQLGWAGGAGGPAGVGFAGCGGSGDSDVLQGQHRGGVEDRGGDGLGGSGDDVDLRCAWERDG